MPLTILYQDQHIVAVYKPAGIVVHRSEATPTNEVALLQMLRDQLNQHVYPVHRLDQPTSGIVLYGLSSKAAASLVEQFTLRRVFKCYQAVVVGHSPSYGAIDTPLSATDNPTSVSLIQEDNAKRAVPIPMRPAKTAFRTLAFFEPPWHIHGVTRCQLSLVEAMPHTGRWHQIRRHLTSIHHPILGDRRHGDERYNEAVVENDSVKLPDRMMLNASYVRFHHPVTQELVELRCDPDSTYQFIVRLLGKATQSRPPLGDERD